MTIFLKRGATVSLTRERAGAIALALFSMTLAGIGPSSAQTTAPALQTSEDLRRVPVPTGFAEPSSAILLRNARLFDGTGSTARPVAMLIEGARITRIANSEQDILSPKGAEIIDAGGKTVMPGLIDLHTHLTYLERPGLPAPASEDSQASAAIRGAGRLRYYLESGITSVRDVGSHGMAPFLLKLEVYLGRMLGPRIFAAGQLIVGTGGHGTESYTFRTAPTYPDAQIIEADGPDAWRAAVRLQFKRGADLIKLASHFSSEEVLAAVEEAHRLGLRVTVDSEGDYTDMAVKAGVDCVEHPLPRADETIRLMAKKGICAVITLVPYQYISAGGGYYYSTSRRFAITDDTTFAMARRLRVAGVKLGVGSDLTYEQHRMLPEPYIQELRNFAKLGYSPAEALVAATKTNSEILGMSDRLGTAVVGKLADLIIVDGRPDQNLEDLRKVETVIVNGRIVVRNGHVFTPRHTEERAPFSTGPK
jgi:imidazolonepropionase-like amidohydrolase